jgi:hypothetical protein
MLDFDANRWDELYEKEKKPLKDSADNMDLKGRVGDVSITTANGQIIYSNILLRESSDEDSSDNLKQQEHDMFFLALETSSTPKPLVNHIRSLGQQGGFLSVAQQHLYFEFLNIGIIQHSIQQEHMKKVFNIENDGSITYTEILQVNANMLQLTDNHGVPIQNDIIDPHSGKLTTKKLNISDNPDEIFTVKLKSIIKLDGNNVTHSFKSFTTTPGMNHSELYDKFFGKDNNNQKNLKEIVGLCLMFYNTTNQQIDVLKNFNIDQITKNIVLLSILKEHENLIRNKPEGYQPGAKLFAIQAIYKEALQQASEGKPLNKNVLEQICKNKLKKLNNTDRELFNLGINDENHSPLRRLFLSSQENNDPLSFKKLLTKIDTYSNDFQLCKNYLKPENLNPSITQRPLGQK